MSSGLNRAQLFGNLGDTPELRYTQSGTAVINLRLATTIDVKVKDKWEPRTDWHSVVVWGPRAEALSKILTKGSSVYIEGEIRTSSFQKEGGEKQYRTEIHANNVILGGKGGGDSDRDKRDERSSRGRGDGNGRDRGGNGRNNDRDRAPANQNKAPWD
jgi:single-strand DNA-binding protein